jgi:hypothetical protein
MATFRLALVDFIKAAAWEANHPDPALKADLVVHLSDGTGPSLAFGRGQHDWRRVLYSPAHGEPYAELRWDEAVRLFCDEVLGPETRPGLGVGHLPPPRREVTLTPKPPPPAAPLEGNTDG